MNYPRLKEISKPYFGCADIAAALKIAPASAKVAAARLLRQGFLLRLKRNTYILKERWNSLTAEDKFCAANLLQVPSYISLTTALSYYQITTQEQQNFIESVVLYRSKEVNVEDDIFRFTKISKRLYFGFIKKDGFFIATAEKAFLDAAYLASLRRYRFDLTAVDAAKLDKGRLKSMLKKFPAFTRRYLESYGFLKTA